MTAHCDNKCHRICVLTHTDSIISSQLEKKNNPQTNSFFLIQPIFRGEMSPGQYSRKWNDLHLYAFYLHTLSFHLASFNLNYNSEVRSLFTKLKVGIGGGGDQNVCVCGGGEGGADQSIGVSNNA